MGVQDLIKKGKTEEKKVKTEKFEAEMSMAEPPKRKISREAETLPSPFDSMYMYPRLDVKTQSPVTTETGGIIPDERKRQKI